MQDQYGLLINYEYCTGCHSCEVACQQEHAYPAGKYGIVVKEHIMETYEKVTVNYLPWPTDMCNLCAERAAHGLKPACVKHCQAQVMEYGKLEDLTLILRTLPKSVLFRL